MANRIRINKPMAEALEKLLRRKDCPLCGQEITAHSSISIRAIDPRPIVVNCSNNK